MRTPSFDPDRAAALVAVVASLLVAVTCASGASPPSPSAPAATPAPPAPSPPPVAVASSDSGLGAGPERASPEGDAAPVGHQPALSLPRFFAALSRASSGGARARVLFIGDSHTAADFLPHALREPLQRRFGNGGPGFVSIGLDKYRHDGLIVKSEGKWRREPKSPAAGARRGDAVLGLSGIRAVPTSSDARSQLELASGAVAGGARWEILFRAPNAARFVARVDSEPERRFDATSGKSGPAGSSIRRVRLESGARATLTIAAGTGSPELFGAIVESQSPGGVVVDTLGINGGRAATALSWDESEWVAEVRARAPALIVLAFGTNEAAGSTPAERFQSQLGELVARAKKGAPDADCLLLGPPDMADAAGLTLPRVIELDHATERAAEDHGCGYFSLFLAMGGEGSMARFVAATPPLAIRDRVHLTARGYEKIGALLATELLAAYDRAASH